MSTDELRLVELTAAETHPLRLAVLRHDTPTKVVAFPEDELPGALHLGVESGGTVVGTSTWIPRPFLGDPAVQLRGMATARHLQGRGIGGLLLSAGCDRMAAAGYSLVWANARDAALAFYVRHGFEPVGDGFVDPTTGLPHHVVLTHLPHLPPSRISDAPGPG